MTALPDPGRGAGLPGAGTSVPSRRMTPIAAKLLADAKASGKISDTDIVALCAGEEAWIYGRLIDARENAKAAAREAQKGLKRCQDKLRWAERTIGHLQAQSANVPAFLAALQGLLTLCEASLSSDSDVVQSALAAARQVIASAAPSASRDEGGRE